MFPKRIPQYRVYALVIGNILPLGEFLGCHIKKMPAEEQVDRGFKPINLL